MIPWPVIHSVAKPIAKPSMATLPFNFSVKTLVGSGVLDMKEKATQSNVKRCEDHSACHFLHRLFGVSKWCGSAKVGGEPEKAQAPKIIAEAAIKNASDSDAALQL